MPVTYDDVIRFVVFWWSWLRRLCKNVVSVVCSSVMLRLGGWPSCTHVETTPANKRWSNFGVRKRTLPFLNICFPDHWSIILDTWKLYSWKTLKSRNHKFQKLSIWNLNGRLPWKPNTTLRFALLEGGGLSLVFIANPSEVGVEPWEDVWNERQTRYAAGNWGDV